MKLCNASLLLLVIFASWSHAQNQRDIAVRKDKQELADDSSWFYDDLNSALETAERTNRPLMVVFR